MAASLFRRGTGLCCIQRELCRVVWRPQTALFSSKPPDRKQPPRRTHIKKAKPQPAVDVAKLLEQLFHQRRPGTAPPVARPTKPPTASSMNVSASNVPPLSKTEPEETSSFPAASVEPLVETTIESPVELILSHPVEEVQTKSTDVSYSAKVEPLIETTVESPVEARHFTVGTLETRAAVVEGPVEPPIDVTVYVAAREVETESTDSGGVAVSHTATVEPLIETTVEPASEKSPSLLETLENRSAVAEGSVEATIETEADTAALSVQINSTDSGPVTLSHAAEEEPLIETTIEPPVGASHFTVGTIETRAAAVEGAVEPPIDVTVDLAAQKVETKSTDSGPVHLSHAAEEEPLIETAIEPAVEASASPVSEGTIEPAGESVSAAVAEGGNRSEEMTLESVTLAEVEASVGTLEKESLSETTNLLEKAAEIIAGEQRTEAEDVVPPEETPEALSLAEDLQMDALVMEELLFSVPAPVSGATGGQIGREAVRADTPDAPGVTDDLKEVLLEEVEEEEEGTPSGNEDGQETHTDLDPVQRLFLEKIKEYNNMRRLNGGLLEAEPDYEKYLSEETAKLRRLYGGGDLSSFPQFTFTEPRLDQDSK